MNILDYFILNVSEMKPGLGGWMKIADAERSLFGSSISARQIVGKVWSYLKQEEKFV